MWPITHILALQVMMILLFIVELELHPPTAILPFCHFAFCILPFSHFAIFHRPLHKLVSVQLLIVEQYHEHFRLGTVLRSLRLRFKVTHLIQPSFFIDARTFSTSLQRPLFGQSNSDAPSQKQAQCNDFASCTSSNPTICPLSLLLTMRNDLYAI